MFKLFNILFIVLTVMSLVGCSRAVMCELGSSTACIDYNKYGNN